MTAADRLERADVLSGRASRPGRELVEAGWALARNWTVGPCAFLAEFRVPCEAEHKRAEMARGRVMQHAQVGFRDPAKSREAYARIYEACRREGARLDRYGLCLDWSMGYPRGEREGRPKGTGMILEGPEDFAALTAMAPVAPHFGDFVLGFPAALENTQAALAAGSTAIGNLGQYFTFRLPHWDDEVATTEATVTALGLIAAQPVEVLVHSNLDDGFAAIFTDLACCLGATLVERHIVEDLIGAKVSHCFGHHFSDPVTRLAFQRALARANPTPGTMVYGNTVSYRGSPAANFASLAGYLQVDIAAQRRLPSGHAVNAVPVSENRRIPDITEIVEAQVFAARLIEQAAAHEALLELTAVDACAERLLAAGGRFRDAVLSGLAEAGFDTQDPAELLLALRRIGPRRLEALFGPGREEPDAPHGRRAVVEATYIAELDRAATDCLDAMEPAERAAVAGAGLKAVVATTDVHEHGKLLVERVLRGLGVAPIEGGVSTDPEDLARAARDGGADLIALSTYNGVALSFYRALEDAMREQGLEIPVLIGGRLNQIPDSSNSSLPVEVDAELAQAGAAVCRRVEDLLPRLLKLARVGDGR